MPAGDRSAKRPFLLEIPRGWNIVVARRMNSSCFFRMRRKELPEETVEAEWERKDNLFEAFGRSL